MNAPWSPRSERARREAWITHACGASPRALTWVLAPAEPTRRAIERRIAARGGALVRFGTFAELVRHLDAMLGLPFAHDPSDDERIQCLAELLATRGDTQDDSVELSRALLFVVDLLRAHGWNGSAPAPPPIEDPAATIACSHLHLLGDAVQELDAWLLAHASLDTIARLRRATRALTASKMTLVGTLFIDGLERLSPVERDLLLALSSCGIDVDVAPWVLGWPASTATCSGVSDVSCWLACLDTGARGVATDDGSVVLVRARDPHDEAEHIATWIAERCARGVAPDDMAVVVSPEDGSADRMRRALARHGVATQGAGVLAARASTAWQVMRAAVRLAWRGVDVVDLTTVLSAPGSGIWGGDRDQLCALLRRSTPGDWVAVRACLDAFATQKDPEVDPARHAQRSNAAQRVGELVAIWEACGPFARLTPFERLVALTRIVDVTIARFMGSVRLADAIRDPRTEALWIAASSQVADAARAVLTRWQRRGISPTPHAPGSWLAEVEGLLGALDDAALPMRGEGVHLVPDAAACVHRPRILVITGFCRGRFPRPPPRPLLLGPVERALLSSLLPDLAAIPDESSQCDDAERFVLRAMATPTEQLVLVAPRRSITGDDLDVALAWRDALAALSPEARTHRSRTSPPSLDQWVEVQLGTTRSTQLARRNFALTTMRRAQTNTAVAAMAPLAASSQATRDLLVSWARPERDFAVAALARSALAEALLTPRSIEMILTCRYAFLMTALLGLRTLPLTRAPTLTRADRTRVAMAAIDHLSRTDGDEDTRVERAIDRAIATTLPWATAEGPGQVAFVELRRSVGRFLRRYADVGQSMGVRPASAPTTQVQPCSTITVPGERPKAIRVDPSSFRAIPLRAHDGRGEVILNLRHGSTRAMRALRGVGLDVETALAPLVLAAAAGSPSVLRLSLSRAEGELVGARQTGMPSLVMLDHDPTLSEHQQRVLTSIAAALDALEADDARYEPITASRAAELDRMRASPCTRCSMRLGCRLGLPGDAQRVP